MAPKKSKKTDQNQMLLNLFQDIHDIKQSLSLEGGNQENLSDFEYRLRQCLKQVLEDAVSRSIDPLDRVEVAARMTRLLGREITKSNIDQWVAMSTVQKRIHVDAMKALCEVTNDFRPMHVFVSSCGFKALEPEEAIYAEYGAKMMMKRMIESDIKDTISNVDEAHLRKTLIKRINQGEVK